MDSATQVLATIQDNTDYTFPRQELAYLIAHPEESTPVLLQLLEDIIENFDAYYANDDFVGHFYAFYLLAQFRETRACPLITQFFMQYGDRAEAMCGDFVTEDLDRVLASVFDGDLTFIKQLIETTTINIWVRGAAINSLTILAVQGILSDEVVVAYFRELFADKLERDNVEAWDTLVVEAVRVYPEALQEEVRQAFDNDLVDEFMIELSTLDEELAVPQETRRSRLHQNNRYTLITDTIAELEWWAAFQNPAPPSRLSSSLGQTTSNLSAPQPKIGRNDPCHCGSGKKYKKCCWPN